MHFKSIIPLSWCTTTPFFHSRLSYLTLQPWTNRTFPSTKHTSTLQPGPSCTSLSPSQRLRPLVWPLPARSWPRAWPLTQCPRRTWQDHPEDGPDCERCLIAISLSPGPHVHPPNARVRLASNIYQFDCSRKSSACWLKSCYIIPKFFR